MPLRPRTRSDAASSAPPRAGNRGPGRRRPRADRLLHRPGQLHRGRRPSARRPAQLSRSTLKHAFGETTIKEQPQRVVTVSWVNDDVALALGVVPVGVPKNEWGGNDKGSTPWKDAALEKLGAGFGSDKAPVQFSEADGSTSPRSPSSTRTSSSAPTPA